MTEQHTPMLQRSAAVADLNKVPGFDPVKLLREQLSGRAVNGAGLTRLGLRYKKLWFRLACPKGRVRIDRLRVTDQEAIIEAQVYLHKDDPTPVANFTAERTVRDTPHYIQAAEYEAMDNALTDAGFGIQLCDLCGAMGEEAYEPQRAPAMQSVQDVQPVVAQPQPAPAQDAAPMAAQPQTGSGMTLEQALSIVADVGMCKGQTLAQIADARPASLRWYIMGCKDASDTLKEGARLVLDSLAQNKAA